MELIIKWGDNTHQDSTKNIRGCYKHGDIIEAVADGETTNKPWLTVLIVTGLSHTKVKKFMESSKDFITRTVSITEAEYQVIKDLQETVNFNDIDHIVYMGKFFDPVLQSNVNGIRTYQVKELCNLHRRRFQIPASLMTTLFPAGPGSRKTITKVQFLNNLDNLSDKFFNVPLKDTNWYAAFKASL